MKTIKNNKRVLLALSGGVDSSVSALILKKQRYEIIACFLKCFSDTKDPLTGECSWLKDKKDAQKIASKLKIPFIQLDLEKEYKSKVINPMLKEYSKGLTPNPDISCNTIIKFPFLIKKAKELNCDFIATGHYAKIKKTKKGFELHSSEDEKKDQTYFLYELNQDILSKTIFPIGKLTKDEVRKIAKENNLFNWNKLGTRGICFVGKIDMNNYLKTKLKTKKGIVKDKYGNIIGTHNGNSLYTIGQRVHPTIGIDIIKPNPQIRWYVAKKEKNNILIAAEENDSILSKKIIKIKRLHFINPKEKIPTNLKARIRHLGKLYPGKLKKNKNKLIFQLNKPLEGIAPGQSIVIYSKTKLIAGGEISLN